MIGLRGPSGASLHLVPERIEHVEAGRGEVDGSLAGQRLDALEPGAELRRSGAQGRLGLDAEVVDVRSMMPLDIDTIAASVSKTGRCLIVHEATRFAGFGAELSASIQEHCFWNLEAPIMRVAGWDTPYPHAFEWEYFPGKRRVMNALRRLAGESV